MTVALGLVLLEIAVMLSTVTVSILVAAIVAATFAPFVLALRKRGWSRITAAAAVFLGAAAVIIATLVIIAIAFIPYISNALDTISSSLATLKTRLAEVDVPPEVGQAIDHATAGLQAWVATSVSGAASSVGAVATVAILGTFLTFFFLMDGDKAWLWAMSSTSAWRRDAIDTAGDDALQRVGGYLRGTAVIAAFDGIAVGVFMFLLGAPLAGPMAVIVFFGRFIPYIGGLVTTLLVVLVTYATVGSTAALILLVLISIVVFIQGKFLAPIIYHKTVHIHPALALIALPAGAALAGIIGLFAAIPVVAFALAISGAVVSVLGVDPTSQIKRDPLVPIWLDRLGQWSWRLLVSIGLLAIVVAAAIQIPIVVLPLVLGIVLAATLAPLASALERRGWSHGRAAIGATLGATFGVIIIVVLTLVSLAGPVSDLVAQATAGAGAADDSLAGNAGPLVTLVQTFGIGVIATIASLVSSMASLGVVLLLAVLLERRSARDVGPDLRDRGHRDDGGTALERVLTRCRPAPVRAVDVLLHPRRGPVLADVPRTCRAGSAVVRRGGRGPRVRRSRRIHARDRRHLALRRGHPVR